MSIKSLIDAIVCFTRESTREKIVLRIFTFNKHFDKENDCVHEPVITKPHHWRRLFITFYIVNFLLFVWISLARFMDLPV